MITQAEIKTEDKEELVDAILKKHKSCPLKKDAVEKNVDRFLQLNGLLRTEVLINFEFAKNLVYTPTIEASRINETMRRSFWNTEWQITTRTILSNAMSITALGLRKAIEKTDDLGDPTHNSKNTSSITVVTQKFKNLLNPHTKKDKEIQPFLDKLEDTTQNLRRIRTEKIDPIVDRLLAHIETNFYQSEIFLPALNEIQDCVDLCQTYCQTIYGFYLDTHIHLENMKSQIANNLRSILEALRIYSEYLESRGDIKRIAIDEKSLSEKNEEIGKRLMEIISPKIYQYMCIIEKMENG